MFSGPNTRMMCVLTLLAASMVGGSAVLAWLEPHPEFALISSAMQRQQAQVAVANTRSTVRTWKDVTLVAADQPIATGGRTLTALTDAGDAHFTVSASGAIRALPGWCEQRSIGSEGELRIGVSSAAAPQNIQRRGVSILIDTLRPYLADDVDTETLPLP